MLQPDAEGLMKYSTVPLIDSEAFSALPVLVECTEECSYTIVYKASKEKEYSLRDGMLTPIALSPEDPLARLTYQTGNSSSYLSLVGKEPNSLQFLQVGYTINGHSSTVENIENGQFVSIGLR